MAKSGYKPAFRPKATEPRPNGRGRLRIKAMNEAATGPDIADLVRHLRVYLPGRSVEELAAPTGAGPELYNDPVAGSASIRIPIFRPATIPDAVFWL